MKIKDPNWMTIEEVADKLGVVRSYLANNRKRLYAWLPEPTAPHTSETLSRKFFPRRETEDAIANGRPAFTCKGWNTITGIESHIEVWCHKDGAAPTRVLIHSLPEDPELISEELDRVECGIYNATGYIVYLDTPSPATIGEYPIGMCYKY